jgi:hypothetical protein
MCSGIKHLGSSNSFLRNYRVFQNISNGKGKKQQRGIGIYSNSGSLQLLRIIPAETGLSQLSARSLS